MQRSVIILLVAVILLKVFVVVNGRTGYGPGSQDWGFIDVRDGAHMFYWLYYTTATVVHYTERPLVIWLQGGPGASSTGYGNFEELGPLTLDGEQRNSSWVKNLNVLFIDNPVGAGFSYAENPNVFTTNNKEIASDLVEFMKGFYKLHPEFQKVPLHIFSESYGGKMAPEFALELHYAIERKELQSNLESVVLGDPWVSPIDSVLAWAPLLLNMGIIDHNGYEKIMVEANKTLELVEEEKWSAATNQWSLTQNVLLRESKGVDFYNIETPTRANANIRSWNKFSNGTMYSFLGLRDLDENRAQRLQFLMRGPVSKALEIPSNVKWDSQSGTTFSKLSGDFMKPALHIVEELLDKTPLKVGVLSGQLDLICATLGTVNGIEKMNWSYKTEYMNAPRNTISVNRVLEGYEKTSRKFTMFWINRAGHMVPADNPTAMEYVLSKIILNT